jgi:hypothetical protein
MFPTEPNPALKKFVEEQFAEMAARFDAAILRTVSRHTHHERPLRQSAGPWPIVPHRLRGLAPHSEGVGREHRRRFQLTCNGVTTSFGVAIHAIPRF